LKRLGFSGHAHIQHYYFNGYLLTSPTGYCTERLQYVIAAYLGLLSDAEITGVAKEIEIAATKVAEQKAAAASLQVPRSPGPNTNDLDDDAHHDSSLPEAPPRTCSGGSKPVPARN